MRSHDVLDLKPLAEPVFRKLTGKDDFGVFVHRALSSDVQCQHFISFGLGTSDPDDRIRVVSFVLNISKPLFIHLVKNAAQFLSFGRFSFSKRESVLT